MPWWQWTSGGDREIAIDRFSTAIGWVEFANPDWAGNVPDIYPPHQTRSAEVGKVE